MPSGDGSPWGSEPGGPGWGVSPLDEGALSGLGSACEQRMGSGSPSLEALRLGRTSVCKARRFPVCPSVSSLGESPVPS